MAPCMVVLHFCMGGGEHIMFCLILATVRNSRAKGADFVLLLREILKFQVNNEYCSLRNASVSFSTYDHYYSED